MAKNTPVTTSEILITAIAIVVQLGIIVYFVRRNRIHRKELAAKTTTETGDTYESLRNLAIHITGGQLKLSIPDSTTLVYGVLLDWNLNESVMTLAAYITGAASLYLSTGEGINGGGKDPRVGEAAVAFVVAAQDYIARAMPVVTTDLPPSGCIRFYLLTNKGLYAAQEQMVHFEDTTSPWLPLFELGSEVMSQIRVIQAGAVPQ